MLWRLANDLNCVIFMRRILLGDIIHFVAFFFRGGLEQPSILNNVQVQTFIEV